MDRSLPPSFVEKCSPQERADVESWWESLELEKQNEIAVLLDQRQESLAYVYARSEKGGWGWQTIPFMDDALPEEDSNDYEFEWKLDYFHHLLDHPSLMNSTDVVARTFRICSRHVSAIEAHRTGRIGSSFACSDASPNCPIIEFMRGFDVATLIGYAQGSRRSVWLCRRHQEGRPNSGIRRIPKTLTGDAGEDLKSVGCHE